MKPVILGNGILGKELAKKTGWDILSRSVNGLDLTDIITWSDKLLPYDTIINCIAYTKTYDDNKQKHWDINYKAVSVLTDYCKLHYNNTMPAKNISNLQSFIPFYYHWENRFSLSKSR